MSRNIPLANNRGAAIDPNPRAPQPEQAFRTYASSYSRGGYPTGLSMGTAQTESSRIESTQQASMRDEVKRQEIIDEIDSSKISANETLWLDENRITASSQPVFEVLIFGTPIENKKPTAYTLNRIFITDASIEGKAPSARKGVIRFIDPHGEWPSVLSNAGAYSNSIEGKGFPNLLISFGWEGLKSDGRSTRCTQRLSGLILKTRFSIDPDNAMTTVEIEFIEAIMSWFANLRFLDPEDMIIMNEIHRDELKNMSAGKLLNFIWKNCSIKREIDENTNSNVDIFFEDTGSDKKIDGRKFRIRFGDSLQDKINEISAQASHSVKSEEGKPDIIWSYERIYKDDILKIDTNNFEYYGIIEYGWKAAPSDATEEDATISNVFQGSNTQIKGGPDLLWKTQRKDPNSKSMITWDSDLNSKEYLTHQAQEKLTQTLAQYTDGDWETLKNFLVEMKKSEGSQINRDLLSAKYREIVERSESGKALGLAAFFGDTLASIAKDENRMNMVETLLKEMTDRSSGSPVDQMAAIINSNVFTGKATILGDPYFGTDLLPYQLKMTMVFEDVGNFARLFQREWLLTHVSHRFTEGQYITEIQLMTYPERQLNMFESDKSAVRIRRDGYGNSIGL